VTGEAQRGEHCRHLIPECVRVCFGTAYHDHEIVRLWGLRGYADRGVMVLVGGVDGNGWSA
jgi:hypothetical protein